MIALYRLFTLIAVATLIGCATSSLPREVKFQINVPDEPYPGSRTKLITFDLEKDREQFLHFYDTTTRIGNCSPMDILERTRAREVMSISFWGEAVSHRNTFYILSDTNGNWITTGFGGVEAYDDPTGFPEYKYSPQALELIRKWYLANIPESQRKRIEQGVAGYPPQGVGSPER